MAKVQTLAWAIIFAVILSATIVRFVGLDRSPPGFIHDEAIPAVNVISIAQTGFDRAGVRYPLFPSSDDGGVNSPTHVYPLILWTDAFGYSPAAFRSVSAIVTTITLVGIFFLARMLCGWRAAVFAVLSASLSPWAFQWARLACDDPTLYPCAVVWGTFFLLRGGRTWNAIAAGMCISVAMYAYPAARLMVPLFLVGLFLLKRIPAILPLVATMCICCFPLVVCVFNGHLLARYRQIAVFSAAGTHELGGSNPLYKTWIVAKNFASQFSASYLFVSGDRELWRATGFCGQLSWLDALAVFLAALVLLKHLRGGGKLRAPLVILIVIVGLATSVLPSALTLDQSPNSLRAVGAWPFFCLLTGFILGRAVARWRYVTVAAAVVGLLFAVFFCRDYFTEYSRYAGSKFEIPAQELAKQAQITGDWNPFLIYIRPMDRPLGQYYLLTYGHRTVAQTYRMLPEPQIPFQMKH